MEDKKFQWTGQFTKVMNGVTLSENHTIRCETREERDTERRYVIETFMPSTKSFPEDEGNVAHRETQEETPKCGVHGTPMTWKTGAYKTTTQWHKAGEPFAFWSCGQKNADSTWCSYKVPKK